MLKTLICSSVQAVHVISEVNKKSHDLFIFFWGNRLERKYFASCFTFKLQCHDWFHFWVTHSNHYLKPQEQFMLHLKLLWVKVQMVQFIWLVIWGFLFVLQEWNSLPWKMLLFHSSVSFQYTIMRLLGTKESVSIANKRLITALRYFMSCTRNQWPELYFQCKWVSGQYRDQHNWIHFGPM